MANGDALIDDYLLRLRTACWSLPRKPRDELLAEVSAHIAEARAVGEAADEVSVRNVLNRLGEPEDVAAAAAADATTAPAETRRDRIPGTEIVTVILLLIGGIVIPVVGWVAGVVLLWSSPRWRWQDKLVGTAIWPGGLLVPGLWLVFIAHTELGFAGRSTTWNLGSVLLGIGITAAPFAVAEWLLHRARGAERAAA